jgi:para-nitrobenzyl esterase
MMTKQARMKDENRIPGQSRFDVLPAASKSVTLGRDHCEDPVMPKPWSIAAAAVLFSCAACSTGGAGTAPELVGPVWRLQEIRSMDDAQGVTRPEPDRRYTVRFTSQGNAEFQLDCNRGSAPYTRTMTEPGRGTLSLGPLATTRAMCPGGSLDARVARDMGFVRSYTIRDRTLSMSMMADGGIYLWKDDAAP